MPIASALGIVILEDIHEAALKDIANRVTQPEMPSTVDELLKRLDGRYTELRPELIDEEKSGIHGRSIGLRPWIHIWTEYDSESRNLIEAVLIEKDSEEVDWTNPVPGERQNRVARWGRALVFIVLLIVSAFIVWYTEDRTKINDTVLRILAAVALTILLPIGYIVVAVFLLQLDMSF